MPFAGPRTRQRWLCAVVAACTVDRRRLWTFVAPKGAPEISFCCWNGIEVSLLLSSMSERVELFRQRAAECRRGAQSALSWEFRLHYQELATRWEELARAQEQLEQQVERANRSSATSSDAP